jgi:hypothetical protein
MALVLRGVIACKSAKRLQRDERRSAIAQLKREARGLSSKQ